MKGATDIAQNVGKVFEKNWQNSCPDWLLVHRPPDAAQSFNQSSALRFSAHSPCDFMMFNGYSSTFYTTELKTSAGAFTFERTEEDKGMIHLHQIESLKKFTAYKNVVSGFILDFRKSGNTYFIYIGNFMLMIDYVDKKSFNESDLLTYGSPVLINKKKLRVNYRYDVEKFLNDVKT